MYCMYSTCVHKWEDSRKVLGEGELSKAASASGGWPDQDVQHSGQP